MTTIAKIPSKCKHGGPIHLKIDPPINDIEWSLSEGGKVFAEGVIKRTVPECAFYVFRSSKDAKGQLKKGDIVTAKIKAADETVTGDIEVT